MTTGARLASWVLVAAGPVMLLAWPGQTRDTGAGQPAPATGRLSGRVITMDAAAQPVRNAIVTLATPALTSSRSAISDDAGRFSFPNLPAGRYTVTASKPAFVTTPYGAKRPGRPGTTVSLGAGQQLSDLVVRLPRGAVIAGRVTDGSGQPISNVQVAAVRADQAQGSGGTLRPGADAFVTDDRGQFRIFGVAPGEYIVAAIPRVTGIGDLQMLSDREIDSALARLQQRRGSRGGASPTLGVSPVASASPPIVPSFGYPPVFYPGTPSAAEAQRVVVATGEERSGVDILVQPVRAAVVEGTIATADGSPLPPVAVSITTGGPPLPLAFGGQPTAVGRPGAEGKFKYTGVVPGKYTILVRVAPAPGRGQPASSTSLPALYAMNELTVSEDVTGLALTLQPMLTWSGRAVFDGTSPPPVDEQTKIRVMLGPPTASNGLPTLVNGVPVSGVGLGAAAPLKTDGTFAISGILPGSYRLSAAIPGAAPGRGWWLRSAMVGGRDVLDTLLDAGGGLADAVLTFSDRHSGLSGTLQTPAGQPASDCFVIVFPTDRALWKPPMRRLQSTRPSSDGAFSFVDLPPGDYWIAALTDIDQDEWQDPEALGKVAAAGAIKITIAEGEQKVQNLRLGGSSRN